MACPISSSNTTVNGTPVGVNGSNVTLGTVSYPTVWIGNKRWLAQNLRGSFGSIGLTQVLNQSFWNSASTAGPAWCYIDNDGNITSSSTLACDPGSLYNLEAIQEINNYLASNNPGWRVATEKDFSDAYALLNNSGNAFKSSWQVAPSTPQDTARWFTDPNNNQQGTNTAKFNATAPGTIRANGTNVLYGYSCTYWTSSSNNNGNVVVSFVTTGNTMYIGNNVYTATQPAAGNLYNTNNIPSGESLPLVNNYYGFSVRLVYEPCEGVDYTGFNGLSQTLQYDSDVTVSNTQFANLTNYPTIWIGAQKWMAVNVVDFIPNVPLVTDTYTWRNTSSPACCYYNNDPTNCFNGLLFNGYAISEINAAADPLWRVPTNNDFNELTTFLGGSSGAGGKLKSNTPTSTTYWITPNTGADNSSGFSAIGTGWRNHGTAYDFDYINKFSYLWTDTLSGGIRSFREIRYNSNTVFDTYIDENSGFSVRLLIPSVQVIVNITNGTSTGSVTTTGAASAITGSGPSTYFINLRNGEVVDFTVTTNGVASFSTLTGLDITDNNTSNASASFTNNGSGLTDPITVYVTFNAIPTYTVTWNANGGSVNPTSSTVNQGSSVTAPTPTRVGYTFNGWFAAASGGSVVVAGGGSYTPTGNITLYAQWTILTYPVTYDANQGTGAPSSQTKTYGVALTLSSTIPTRPGFTFTGWNTQIDGSGASYQPGANYTLNAAVTLYAQWSSSTPDLNLTCVQTLYGNLVSGLIVGQQANSNTDFVTFGYTGLSNGPFTPAPSAGPFPASPPNGTLAANVVPGGNVPYQPPLVAQNGTIFFQISGTPATAGTVTIPVTYGTSGTCDITFNVINPTPPGDLIVENNINLERGGYIDITSSASTIYDGFCNKITFRVRNTGGATPPLSDFAFNNNDPAFPQIFWTGTFKITHSDGTIVANVTSFPLTFFPDYPIPLNPFKALDQDEYFDFEFISDFVKNDVSPQGDVSYPLGAFSFYDVNDNFYPVTYPLDNTPSLQGNRLIVENGLHLSNVTSSAWSAAIANQLGGTGAVANFGTVLIGDSVSLNLPIYNTTINTFPVQFGIAPLPQNNDFTFEYIDENGNVLSSSFSVPFISPDISPLGDTNIFWTLRITWTPTTAYSISGSKAELDTITCDGEEGLNINTNVLFNGNSISETGGTIAELQCNNSTVNGGPLADGISVPAGTTFTIGYTGGDGGVYSTQTISSSSVTGIMATLQSGTFSVGSGTLTYNLSGVPNGNGEASFLITFNGPDNTIVSCTVVIDVTPVIDLDYFGCGSPQYPNGAPSFTTNTNQTVEINIPYSAQQGGEYAGATINSTGVTGLQLELFPMSITSGSSGVFVGNISGVASTPGNAVFNICVGGYNGIGQDCCNLIIPISSQPTTIQSLDCDNAIVTGTLLYPGSYAAVNNITISLNYTGANGGSYPTVSIPSSGVQGLFATISSGTLNGSETVPGSGTLVYTIIGTPSGVGTATFVISIGGQECVITTEVTGVEGTISSLDCEAATTNTTLISGASVNGIVLSVPYTGGNGGTYNGQTLTSNSPNQGAVTGTLAPGTLAVGNGSLFITLSGTMPAGFVPITFDFEFPEGSEPCLITLTPEVDAGTAEVDCSSLNVEGAITYPTPIPVNQPVQLWLNYSNSNGGSYGPATFISQPPGVGGLTAILPEGQFNLNDGFVQLSVTGTPQSSGNAIFVVNIGGTECTLTVPVGAPEGTIDSLNCSGASSTLSTPVVSGQIIAPGTTFSVNYFGSNGGSYLGNTANSSTIVTGITAQSTPGVFSQPNGSVLYTLTGTPVGSGNATFTIQVADKSCTVTLPVSAPSGEIDALNCNAASFSGSFTQGFFNTVTGTIPYTGGNGGQYATYTNTQSGLTLTIPAGTFNNGAGNVNFTITGNPTTSGTVSFPITLGGVSCNLQITVGAPTPVIDDLRCSETVVTGTLSVGQPSAVSFTLYYYGSNQQPYPQNTSNSTGVTGLTATTPNGTFTNPTGTLVYTVTGTPQSTGTATFIITIGTQSCTVTIPVTQPNYFGPESPSPCQEVTYTDPGCEVLNETCYVLVNGDQVSYTTVSSTDPCQISFQVPCDVPPGSTATITFENCEGDVIIEEELPIGDPLPIYPTQDSGCPGDTVTVLDASCILLDTISIEICTDSGCVAINPTTVSIIQNGPLPCSVSFTLPASIPAPIYPADSTIEFEGSTGPLTSVPFTVLDCPTEGENTFDPPGGALPGDEVTFTNPNCDIVTEDLDQILVNGVPATIAGTSPAPGCSVTFVIPSGIDCGNSTIEFVDNLGNVIGSQEYPIGCEGNDDGTYTVTFTPQDEGCHLIYFKTTGEDYCVYQADGPFEVGVPVTITINLIDYADCLGTVPPVACVDPLRVTGFIRPCCTQDGSKDVDLNFVEYQIRPCKSYQVTCPSGNCGTFTRSNCSPKGCFGYTDSNTYALASGTSIYVCSEGEGVVNTENSIYEISEQPFGSTKTFFYPSVLPTFDSTNPNWTLTSFAWVLVPGVCTSYNSQPWTGGRLRNLSVSLSSTVSYANPSFLTPGDLYTIRFKMSWSNIVPTVVTVSSGANNAYVTVATGSSATWTTTIVAGNGPFSITIPAGSSSCLQITAIEKTVEMPINCCYCVNHTITFSHKPSLDVYYSQCNENGSEFIQQTITSGTTLCAVFNSVFPVLKSDSSSMTIDVEDPC